MTLVQCSVPEQVWVVCVPLRPVHEGPELVDLDQPEDPEYGLEPQRQVQEVQGQQAQAVHVEGGGVDVVLPELGGVGLQHAILEIDVIHFM